MRVALLTPGISPNVVGGLQRHSHNLFKNLIKLGVEVDLYHTDFNLKISQNERHLTELSQEERKRVKDFLVPWSQNDKFPGHYIRKLKKFSNDAYEIFQEQEPVDFVISKSLTGWKLALCKQKGLSVPPIAANFHGYEMFQTSASLRSIFENSLLRRNFYRHAQEANYLFSYGGKITELIRDRIHAPKEKIVEISGGINPAWIAEEITSSIRLTRFIFVGRYERRKGIQELHSAIRANPGWQHHANFRFVGPIPERDRLQLPHVSYAGSIRDSELLKQELRQADVLLCPSHSEGMPNVILEAMGSGLAVLATDVGAVRLLVDSNNGVLLPKISISGLSKGINQLLALNESQLQQRKQISLERVKSFTWEKIAVQTRDAIEKIISKS